jgi:16S rRNA (adenine1518-N6/adenine1519-N6)-dimethyltransferase
MKRRKGQNFLMDPDVIEHIAEFACLTKRDRVLEIGSGTGNLTRVLAERAGYVFAVEVDPKLATELQGKFDNVQVIRGNALKVEFPDYNKVVSNLPYQVSSKITYRLLTRPFEVAVLMYQREFAQRMLARPGDAVYGRMAMIMGYFCFAENVETVSRLAFYPSPKVESSLMKLKLRKNRPEVDAVRFMRFVGKLFEHRRKKVRKVLSTLGVSEQKLAGIDPYLLERRPEELWPDEAASLVDLIPTSASQ